MLIPFSRGGRKPIRAKRNAFRPSIESCEARQLLAVAVGFDVGKAASAGEITTGSSVGKAASSGGITTGSSIGYIVDNPAIKTTYSRLSGVLGGPTGHVMDYGRYRRGWVGQDFQNGAIYTDGTTTIAISGAAWSKYKSIGREAGQLGLPIGNGVNYDHYRPKWWGQDFQNGAIYTDGESAVAIGDAAWRKYVAAGRERSVLGLPIGNGVDYGRYRSRWWGQDFQNGAIYTDGASTVLMSGIIWRQYKAMGREGSSLGLPVANFVNYSTILDGWSGQDFQNGGIYSDGMFTVVLGDRALWRLYVQEGRENGPLGLPTSNGFDAGDGLWGQTFQNGVGFTDGKQAFVEPGITPHTATFRDREWKRAYGREIGPVDWAKIGVGVGASIYVKNPAPLWAVLKHDITAQAKALGVSLGIPIGEDLVRQIVFARGQTVLYHGYAFKFGIETQSREFWSATRDGVIREAEDQILDYLTGYATDWIVEADIPVLSDLASEYQQRFGLVDINVSKPYIAWRRA